MPTNSWDLALAEIIYYVPTAIPTAYCLWRHRSHGLLGWIFFIVFVLLQIIGSGMSLSAGENGTPSSIAIILTGIGMSPLLLGLSGIVHEWIKVCGLLRTPKARKLGWAFALFYHLAVAGAVGIYAVGSSNSSDPTSDPSKVKSGDTLAEAGVLLLLLLWFILYLIFGFAAARLRPLVPCQVLFWSIVAALILLGARLIYATVSSFNGRRGVYNPVTGSIALRVVFEFLPGALVMLVMVVGGIMSIEDLKEEVDYRAVGDVNLPLRSRYETD